MAFNIFYDFEATLVNPVSAHALELAACVSPEVVFHRYIKCPADIKITNSDIHGITEEVLKEKKARSAKTVLNSFVEWVDEITHGNIVYMVAHNNFRYDQILLEVEFKRVNIDIPKNWRFADTYSLANHLYLHYTEKKGIRMSLSALYQLEFNKLLDNAHNALVDAKALYDIYHSWVNKFQHIFDFPKYFENHSKIAMTHRDIAHESPAIFPILSTKDVVNRCDKKGITCVGQILEYYIRVNGEDGIFDEYLHQGIGLQSAYVRNTILMYVKYVMKVNDCKLGTIIQSAPSLTRKQVNIRSKLIGKPYVI